VGGRSPRDFWPPGGGGLNDLGLWLAFAPRSLLRCPGLSLARPLMRSTDGQAVSGWTSAISAQEAARSLNTTEFAVPCGKFTITLDALAMSSG
jgi:hypothetical protein